MPGPPPSPGILTCFGVPADSLRAQPGGQGRAWRAGDVILKPVEDPIEAQWTAELLAALPQDGFRISRPVMGTDAQFVVEGWSAWEVVPGSHDADRWCDVIATGRALNKALASVARPSFLDNRTSVWSVGDRSAWGEQPLQVYDPALAAVAQGLRAQVTPDHELSQLIHGDLSGNVLFCAGLAPAVIDFTPYWRPAAFALAIVAVDAVCWQGATGAVFDAVAGTGEARGMLARAGLYRLVASDRAAVAMPDDVRTGYLAENGSAYLHLLAALDDWRG